MKSTDVMEAALGRIARDYFDAEGAARNELVGRAREIATAWLETAR